MHPNDAQLSRVYTREVNIDVSDLSFSVQRDFEVVVEAEAGSTIFDDGARYHVDVVIIDYSENATAIPDIISSFTKKVGGNAGFMGDPPWTTPSVKFVFTVPATALTNRADHMCQAYAFLRVSKGKEPMVSIKTSEFFLLHA